VKIPRTQRTLIYAALRCTHMPMSGQHRRPVVSTGRAGHVRSEAATDSLPDELRQEDPCA
jgi:hypothetical protein